MSALRLVILLTLSLLVAACGELLNPITPIDSGVTVHADSTGDAEPPPTYDVIELRVARGSSDLQARMWTEPAAVLPAPGFAASGTELSGGVGFNTDLNAATGGGFVSPCGGGQGLERFVDLTARNVDGTYNVLNVATLAITGTAAVSQEGPRVTFTVPFFALGTGTGRTMANAIVGFNAGVFIGRDCVPDAGQMLPTQTRGSRHPLIR
ncbi:MAG: hypothetical protein QN178_14180 [Armatimonadota bacterium]|nr:hypothetical protein [Armatimonadota bacterium]